MKTIPFSLCVGLALLGSIACGNSNNTQSTIDGAGSGTPPSPSGSGGSGSAPYQGTGGIDIFTPVPTGGAPSGTGTTECAPGNTTTISGIVYDPAGKNPLYNISVYVLDPSSPLPNLDNIPVACGCSQLLPAKVLAIGAPTDASGHFEIPCAPSGTVSLVVQTGKWRRQYDNVKVVANQQNVIPNLRLPANSSEGSLPNIAISTGGSDSFECLPLRIGVSASEYVAGSASGGHIHIYSGLRGATPAQGAVESYKTLWDSQAHLNEHDVVILSCEGEETKGGNPGVAVNATAQQYLMNYANAGGRVFATHYQYAWFSSGPFNTGANTLATWAPGMGTLNDNQSFPAEINTTLKGGAAFPEGSALAKWLGLVGALTNNQLPVWFVRNNVKALVQPPSTEWLHLSASSPQAPSAPQYFSADTPVGATGSAVCGRVVYSALHVSGGPNTNAPGVPVDYPRGGTGAGGAGAGGASGAGGRPGVPGGPGGPGGPIGPIGMMQGGIVPSGCAMHPLTPQEAALEFMFFDLSSCLVPIGEEPPTIPK
ncbi:MAG: hypothetical protein WDO74_02240 [Pseudomonadota bacterium]